MASGPVDYQVGAFPPSNLDWGQLVPEIGAAQRAVGQYDSLLRTIPNPDAILAPMRARESVLSSRIEGTQTSLLELLEFEAEPERSMPDLVVAADRQEVRNYRLALDHAIVPLDELPLSNRLIRGAHRVLMQGVRGEDKDPGEFRRSQNWIGAPGCDIEQAVYVP